MAKTPFDRFWSYVPMRVEGTCWLWHGAKKPSGYGVIESKGQTLHAHRVAWSFVNGPIPEGMVIRHTCDNPSCVNPSHLLLGTYKDNGSDMVSRGRSLKGSRHSLARLTECDVIDIKRSINEGTGTAEISRKYRVSQSTICDIKMGRTWSHINE